MAYARYSIYAVERKKSLLNPSHLKCVATLPCVYRAVQQKIVGAKGSEGETCIQVEGGVLLGGGLILAKAIIGF